MSGLEVGGWFVSAGLGLLIETVHSYINDQYKARSNMKERLKSLERDLTKIQTIILEADNRRIENQALKDWLRDVKDAAYDAEDVLDMYEYQKLAVKVEKPNKVGKLFYSLRNRHIGLTEVVDRFKGIADDMGHFIEMIKLQPTISLKRSEIMRSRQTTSMPINSKIFGREKERDLLIRLLLQGEGDGHAGASSSVNVHILPIVGIGGVGKTTIAQDLYNDQNVKSHFDLKAWVCVSDDFDVKRLVTEIIESAKIVKPQDFHNLQNLDSIVGVLKEGLTGKRFLIVLDDVWNEVETNWDKLHSALTTGKGGSRVIDTTRSPNIAKLMGTKEALCLEGLADQEFLKIFKLCAFGDKKPVDYPGLEQIGEQIAKRLGGNPLAAKTIGGVLRNDFDGEHWTEVLNSELWRTDEKEGKIMSVLRLSYEYLPAYLKQCFVYCCLFPKDYIYSKKKLVRLWMAQGFLLKNQKKREEIYIDELVSRSFLQKCDNEYVLYDLLHDLAQNLSNSEIFIVDDRKDRKVKIPERVRHISIHASNLSLLCNHDYVKKNLRSLVVSNYNEESLVILEQLKGLCVLLICGEYTGELSSESFHGMFHLRYLEIENYELRGSHKLPKSLGKLYHLQVLNVGKWQCYAPSAVLPKETNKLINLHHLGANTAEIVGIGRLILLQKLSFHVKQRESGFEIGQLGEMSQLRKLYIEGLESVESKEQASEAMLENKEHFKYLQLKWKHENINLNLDVDDSEVLEGLQPHQNLKHICIVDYGGRSPSWWNRNSLSYLESIRLYGCSKWGEILLPLGQLCFLKEVYLVRMNAVRRIVTSASAFPSLVHLHVSKMPELEELSEVEEEGLQLFPRLSILSVYKCPKLKGSRLLFPPSQFKDVTIDFDVEDDDVVRFKCETDEKIAILFSRSKISMLDEWIPWNNLTFITIHLCIVGYCLPSIPREWFQHLNSLRKLSLKYSDEIKSLPEVGLPAALQRLLIWSCRNLSEKCRKDGPDWHKISHIPYINIDAGVVQNLRNDDGYDHLSHLSYTDHDHSGDDDDDDDDDDDIFQKAVGRMVLLATRFLTSPIST